MDWPVLLLALTLTGIGILALASAAPLGGSPWTSPVLRQTVFALLGFGVLVFLLLPHYLRFRQYAYILYVGCLVLLVVLLVTVGTPEARRGVRRWFDLGLFTVQPSELAKIGLILVLARYLMYRDNLERPSALIMPAALTVAPAMLVLLQPDLGTALIFFPTLLVMLYVGGARRLYLLTAIVIVCASVPVAYHYVLKDYQRKRIDTFLDPAQSPEGAGYQALQSQIAIGSGGVFGRGWRNSAAYGSHPVPERHNDFIFVVLAEEFGFAGGSLVVLLYAMFFALCVNIAHRTREPFGRLVVTGVLTSIAVQTYVNIAMTVGLLPVTGVTLPFVSYGGTSLVTSFMMTGLVLSVSMRHVPMFDSKEFEQTLEPLKRVGLKGEGLELLAPRLIERGK
ncbi:MAG: rod shape-determining protein RodA [Planctomycetota bacterium]|nr:rod shape-determining protein RodA [Planctomycetota bacterium]